VRPPCYRHATLPVPDTRLGREAVGAHPFPGIGGSQGTAFRMGQEGSVPFIIGVRSLAGVNAGSFVPLGGECKGHTSHPTHR
jgi:hypothetical protein